MPKQVKQREEIAVSAGDAPEKEENTSSAEILRAAAELFMDLGFAATSIDAIANRLGSTKGRIYHHFRSKAEIYFSIQREGLSILFSEVEPIAKEALPPEDRLAKMACKHVEVMLNNLPLQKVAVQSLDLTVISANNMRYTRELREIVRIRDRYEDMFCEVIDEGSRNGIFEDLPARLLSKPFFGSLNWLTIWYRPRTLQKREDLRELAGILSEFAMRGIKRGIKA